MSIDAPATAAAGDGVILCDKPAGKTSHDVVAAVRRARGRGVKVGHAGTLDPFATGLLLVLVGRATRVQRFLMALPKTYETVARLGARSSTGDPEGEIDATGVQPPDPFVLPTGAVRQRPPAHSAIRVDGERAYRRARRGEDVAMPERTVTVHRFDALWRTDDRAAFRIECSSGTYVRSLIADLHDAYCLELRRTRIGPFDVADADGATLVPLDRALDFLPEVRLGDDDARRAGHGVAVPLPAGVALAGAAPAASEPYGAAGAAGGDRPAAAPGGAPPLAPVVRLTDTAGLIALAEPRAAGGDTQLKPVVGFRG